MAEPASMPAINRAAIKASTAAFCTLALSAILFWPPPLLLLWNVSASSPVGLYGVVPERSPRAGEMIIAWPPKRVREIASTRDYLPARVPLVKPVAAVSGARVCAIRSAIFVNGRLTALRRARDLSGRLLPWWSGCERLGKSDLFLLSPDADAFDGRYFGITRTGEVIGTARLLWAR